MVFHDCNHLPFSNMPYQPECTKSTRSSQGDTSLPKISKKVSSWKIYYFKILNKWYPNYKTEDTRPHQPTQSMRKYKQEIQNLIINYTHLALPISIPKHWSHPYATQT